MATKKRARAKEISFGDAVEEVEQILGRLEAEEIDIDDLSREVGRAVELIKLCRRKLEKTDGEVRDLVAELRAEGEERPPSGKPAGGDGAPDDGEADDENLPF